MSDLGYSNMHRMLKDFLCDLQRSAANLGVPGISSGFSPLDRLTGGFENGKVYVSKPESKPVSLKDFGTDNRAVGKLVKALDLEEEPMEKACVEKVLDHVFYFK